MCARDSILLSNECIGVLWTGIGRGRGARPRLLSVVCVAAGSRVQVPGPRWPVLWSLLCFERGAGLWSAVCGGLLLLSHLITRFF